MTSTTTKTEKRYTWEDYRRFPDDERWQIVNGEAFMMAPSPGFRHQDVSMKLSSVLSNHFKGKDCRPFAAPFDVKLSDDDVVQPDLMVVCDPDQIKDTHVEGAPKLLIEIVSPSSESFDRIAKMRLYEKFGVSEYWIVTPYPPLLEIYQLDDSKRFHLHSGGSIQDVVASPSFPDLEVNLSELFDLPYTEEERKIFKVKESPAKYQPNSQQPTRPI